MKTIVFIENTNCPHHNHMGWKRVEIVPNMPNFYLECSDGTYLPMTWCMTENGIETHDLSDFYGKSDQVMSGPEIKNNDHNYFVKYEEAQFLDSPQEKRKKKNEKLVTI